MEINKKELLENYFKNALEEIKNIVSIPSYRKVIEKGSPVDKDIVEALKYVIKLCKSFGWNTFIAPDNRYGYAEYGQEEKLFGIICHLDVVPPGNISEWNTDPFCLTQINGKLYGRGILDDKGPSIINIFAFKYLIDKGFKPDYKVRFIFGTSEETTWECMEAYTKREQLCDLGYVPDGYFPVVYAEKSILDLDLIGNFKCNFKITGGQIYNAVNDLVKYQGPYINEIINYLKENDIQTYVENHELYVKGVAAHGSLPQFGKSAATWLLSALNYLQVKHPLVKFVSEYIHLNYDMKQIYGDLTDETGSLTVCNGIIDLDQNGFRFTLNHRIPCTKDPEKDILLKLINFCKNKQIKVKKVKSENRVYFDKNSKVVLKIMDVYKEVTRDFKAEPIAIGGGTFAKSMPNMIAFGAIFDESTSTMHASNEFVTIDELKKMLEIYTKSLIKLLKES